MQLTKQKRGGCDILLVSGRLDGITSPQFETELNAWLRQGGKHFVLDLAEVSFLSSAALRVLLSVAKRATREGGQVVLSSPGEVVREVFEISNFTALFTIFASLDEAVLGLEPGSANEGAVAQAGTDRVAPKPESPAAALALPAERASQAPPVAKESPAPAMPAPAPPVATPAPVVSAPPVAPPTPAASPPLRPQPGPAGKLPGLQVVVGTKAISCRDGDILGREGTVAKHLFGELEPRHAMIGRDGEGWFLLVPKGVHAPTRLDGVPILPGVRQRLTGEHRLSAGTFSATLRLVEAAGGPEVSLLGRLLRLLGLARRS